MPVPSLLRPYYAETAICWAFRARTCSGSGYVRIKNLAPRATILELESSQIVLLNWLRLFSACIRLPRSLSKAVARSIPAAGPVVPALVQEATTEAAASVQGDTSVPSDTLQDLTELLATVQ